MDTEITRDIENDLPAKEKVIRAASKIFSEKSYKGTTLRSIGDAAGVNFQIIRHHFGSKEGLLFEVIDRLCRDSLSASRRWSRTLTEAPSEESLKDFMRHIVHYHVKNPEVLRILTMESVTDPDLYRELVDKYQRVFSDNQYVQFHKLQQCGIIRDDISTEYLVQIVHGALLWRSIFPLESEVVTGKSMLDKHVMNMHADSITQLILSH